MSWSSETENYKTEEQACFKAFCEESSHGEKTKMVKGRQKMAQLVFLEEPIPVTMASIYLKDRVPMDNWLINFSLIHTVTMAAKY